MSVAVHSYERTRRASARRKARALAQRITSGQLRLTVNDRGQVTEQHGQPIGWSTLATAMRTGLVDLAVLGGEEEPG